MSNKPTPPRGPGGNFVRAGESEKLHPPSTRKKISASQYWAEAEARIAADTPFPIQDEINRGGHNPDDALAQLLNDPIKEGLAQSQYSLRPYSASANDKLHAALEDANQNCVDILDQAARDHRMRWIGITLGIALLAMLIVAAIAWPR